MKTTFLIVLVTFLVGCSGGDKEPVQGDNPAAAGGQSVTPEMQRTGGPPRNTLPAGQGRTGGGTGDTTGGAVGR